jgi:hypothetical protein
MKTTAEKAAAALELLPEDMREPAIAYLLEQAEKFQTLKTLIQEGIEDIEAGRTREWDFADFLRRARDARHP